MTYKDINRIGDDYSITSKMVDYIGNPEWKVGYDELKETGDNTTGFGVLWNTISAGCEDIASDIYVKVRNYVSNLNDIDTCELHTLKSLTDMVGYSGNVEYLDFVYPTDVAKLVDIFSIKKDYLLKSGRILDISSRSDIFNIVKDSDFDSAVMEGYDLSAFSASEQAYIESVSADPVTNMLITDDETYISYIDAIFYDALIDNIYAEYREYELGIETNEDTDKTTFDPTVTSNSTKSGYIWKNIINSLNQNKLFKDENSDDENIREAKIKYGIELWFPEKKYVDEINAGIKNINEFNTTERIILQLEVTRREEERDEKTGVSRFYVERENRVKSYFQFIELFNRSTDTETAKLYDLDDTKFVIDPDVEDTYILISNDDGTTSVNTEAIQTTAVKLRNLVLKVSYLRDILKPQAQKYYINGTELILKDLIDEYFNRYVYGFNTFWRSSNDTDLGNIPTIDKNANFNIDIIEYIDTTEYMNISAYTDAPSADVNPRYWESNLSGQSVFSNDEIVDFYKNTVGVKFLDSTSGETSGYAEQLDDFLNTIYNMGATSATVDTLTTTSEVLSTVNTGIYYMSSDDVTVSGEVDKYPLSDDLFLSGYADYRTDNGEANQGWIILNAGDVIDLDTDPTSPTFTALKVATLIDRDAGYMVFTDALATQLEAYTDYLIEIEMYTENINSVPTEARNYFQVFDGVSTYSAFGGNTVNTTWQTFYHKFTTNGDPSLYRLISSANEADDSYEPYIKYIKIYKMGEPSTDTKTYFVPSDSLTLSSYTTSASVQTLVDNAGAYFKYIGTPSGDAPYANIKNQIHPSYMAHPYMKAFQEYLIESVPIQNIFDYVTEGYEADYAAIDQRIDDYGNLVNYWWNTNIDFSGYRTNYEVSTNEDEEADRNPLIDYDSPFFHNALVDLYNDPVTSITSVRNRSGVFYDEYYSHLGLSESQAEKIYDQLNYITITGSMHEEAMLNKLMDKVIYKYCVDQFNNIYVLYKDNNTFDELGQIWMRIKDHPIAFPAFIYDDSESNERSSVLSQLPFGLHNSLGDQLIDLSDEVTGEIAFYDMNFDNSWLYLVFKEPDIPYSDAVYSSVMFGEIYDTESADETYVEYGFTKDVISNFEATPFKAYNKYIGTYVKNNTFTSVFVETGVYGQLSNDNGESGYTQFISNLVFVTFDPVQGVANNTLQVPVKYQTTVTSGHNEWLLSNNEDNLSIAFESSKPPINTDDLSNYINNEEVPFVTYNELVEFDNLPTMYDNGMTVIDIDITGIDAPNTASTSDVSYFYMNSDINYLSLYPDNVSTSKIWESDTISGGDNFKLQFFGEPIGVGGSFVYEDEASPITSLSAFQAMDTIIDPIEPPEFMTSTSTDSEGLLEDQVLTKFQDVGGYWTYRNEPASQYTTVVAWNVDHWEVTRNSVVFYTNATDQAYPPKTGWVVAAGGDGTYSLQHGAYEPVSINITDAGSTEVNGVYVRNGSFNNRPRYTMGAFNIYYDDGNWRLDDAWLTGIIPTTISYVTLPNTSHIPPMVDWLHNPFTAALAPVPTVGYIN
jgi:hypothetical protein